MKQSLLSIILLLITSYSIANEPLVIATYGGAWEKAQHLAMIKPFMDKTGLKMVTVPKAHYGLAKLRAMVESNSVVWDVIDMNPQDAIVACDEGLLEPINHNALLAPASDGTLPLKDYFKAGISKCAVPTVSYSILFATKHGTYKTPPKTIADIFNIKKFPGKRGLQKKPINNLEWALHADGVPLSKIYKVLATPEGLKRAFAKLDTIKNHIIWWTSSAQSPQMLANQEVSIASGYNGRFFNAMINHGKKYDLIWDGQLVNTTVWAVPKGKLSKDIKTFLHDAASPSAITKMSRIIATGPARISAAQAATTHLYTGQDLTPFLPTAKQNMFNMAQRNGRWWAEHGDKIYEKFNIWLAK
mgnify:FL=1|jgi:putative spermidine/putrescine transport system substrate-binding protein